MLKPRGIPKFVQIEGSVADFQKTFLRQLSFFSARKRFGSKFFALAAPAVWFIFSFISIQFN